MKENYDLEQFDLNQQNQKSIKIDSTQNLDESNQYIIVIHFSLSKSFSFSIPTSWDSKKLISFIILTFKSELRHKIPAFICKGNLKLPFNETSLKDYLDTSKVNHIMIALEDKESIQNQIQQENKENKENKDKPILNKDKKENDLEYKNILKAIFSLSNNEIFKSDEFADMEKNALDDYNKIFKENTFNNFPIMSPAYNKRREQIKYDSQTERLAQFEPIPLEDFPFSNYFQLKIIFKCIISFFALGIYIKGFNFVLFLFVLVIYYWYCINNIMEEFYKKKFQQIGLTEDEYKRIGNEINNLNKKLDDEDEEESENENDTEENNKNDNENIIYEENKDDNININKEGDNNIKIDLDEEKKEIDTNIKSEDNKNIKEPMKDLEFKNDIKNELNEDIKNIIRKNKKKEIKKEKKDEENENEHEEPEEQTTLQIAYQILYVFLISFIPPWCDEFEAQNPMPVNNPPNPNNNNNNNVNQNNNIGNNIINDNNIINNINLNDNINNDINDNNINQINQEEDSNNNKMTSSKVANISEDSNRDNKMYNLIKKDNQSLNENEYVFSENGGIDSLSMNSEIYKIKKEKEKEKEKDKDNYEIKEKQIFEEDEDEKIIEEDKHLKNE